MNYAANQVWLKLRALLEREEGQDLVEYALVVALLAFGCVAGMSSLTQGINSTFGHVSTILGQYVS